MQTKVRKRNAGLIKKERRRSYAIASSGASVG